MKRWLRGLFVVLGCLLCAAAARAGDAAAGGRQPGGPDPLLPPAPGVLHNLITQHAADLQLTAEQLKKLEEIKKDLPPPAEHAAFTADPEIRELMKKFREAIKSGDRDTAKAVRKELAEKFKERHPRAAKLIEAVREIL